MPELEHIKSIIEMGSAGVVAFVAIMLLKFFLNQGKKLLELVTKTTTNHLTHIEQYTKESRDYAKETNEFAKDTNKKMGTMIDLLDNIDKYNRHNPK